MVMLANSNSQNTGVNQPGRIRKCATSSRGLGRMSPLVWPVAHLT
jgi:hypothetical protein